jgi:hypothetical protein
MQHAEIGQLLDEAIARGGLARCDVPRVSRVLLAAINGVFALWNLNDARTPADALREVFDVVLGPLRLDPSPRPPPLEWEGERARLANTEGSPRSRPDER